MDDSLESLGIALDEAHYRISELEEEVKLLDCLIAAGVDNWEGFEHALDMMED